MAYPCPRCGQPVQRSSSTGAAVAGGLVGALFYAAFGDFQCKACGKIPKREFPPETQKKMTTGSIVMIAVAIVVVVLCVVLLTVVK